VGRFYFEKAIQSVSLWPIGKYQTRKPQKATNERSRLSPTAFIGYRPQFGKVEQ